MPTESHQQISVAIDFSPQTPAIIEKALYLKEKFTAHIELIHVLEIPVYPVLEDLAVMGTPGLWDEDIAKNSLKSANEKLSALANHYGIESYKVISGLADIDICEHAKQSQTDLIVMGSHGESGWKRLIGSTTNAVINHAPCDVFLVRTKEKK